MKWRELLRKSLEENNLDCIIFFNGENFTDKNVYYFSNFDGTAVLVIDKVLNRKLFVPKMELNRAEKISCAEEIAEWSKFKNYFKEIKRVGIIIEKIPFSFYSKFLTKAFFVDVSAEIYKIRAKKTKKEIEIMKKCCKITNKVVKFVKNLISEDLSELEISKEIEVYLLKNKVEKAFDIIVAFNKNSSFPHHNPTNLKNGKIGIIDFGVKYKNYVSDVTIPFSKKSLNRHEKEIIEKVLDAYYYSLDLIKEEKNVINFFKKVEKKIGEKFIHSLGHSIGLEIHEPPFINDKNPVIKNFDDNFVVALEPAIYIKEKFGFRIENDLLLYRNKVKILTNAEFLL